MVECLPIIFCLQGSSSQQAKFPISNDDRTEFLEFLQERFPKYVNLETLAHLVSF